MKQYKPDPSLIPQTGSTGMIFSVMVCKLGIPVLQNLFPEVQAYMHMIHPM